RQFLDEEAALSEDEDGAAVSSDEDDGDEQNLSLDGFVVDNTHLSQGLNFEMRGIYLKSVRSPAVPRRFKMSHQQLHNTDIFSQQVPEQDETYKEDSFVVGSQEDVEEEEESAEEAVELMPEDSFVDGRRQYATRRRVFLHKARAKADALASRAEPRSKFSRVLRLVDSSEEEEGADVLEPPKPVKLLPQQKSGVELVTSLRQHHGATVHVCSLDSSYFIVSARMAVERHAQSDLASPQNRKRLAEKLGSVQERFERVCLIVEKDRTKPEVSRPFHRTRCYDTTLSALVRSGVRLLWSDGPQQSATLLVELAQLERRKGQAFAPPSTELSGQHEQQDLQFYLSLPAVNYVHALNMSRRFRSVAQLVNSVESLERGGGMSRARAEEIFRFLRYNCD
uniref:FA complementation group M n=1 Tax=Hippocampus comes TaxID=109280 RepID=A0A3Q3DFS2_HIPCM